MTESVRVSIVGGSGYGGGELLRLLWAIRTWRSVR